MNQLLFIDMFTKWILKEAHRQMRRVEKELLTMSVAKVTKINLTKH